MEAGPEHLFLAIATFIIAVFILPATFYNINEHEKYVVAKFCSDKAGNANEYYECKNTVNSGDVYYEERQVKNKIKQKYVQD